MGAGSYHRGWLDQNYIIKLTEKSNSFTAVLCCPYGLKYILEQDPHAIPHLHTYSLFNLCLNNFFVSQKFFGLKICLSESLFWNPYFFFKFFYHTRLSFNEFRKNSSCVFVPDFLYVCDIHQRMGGRYLLYRKEHDCSRYLFCSNDFLTVAVHTSQCFLLWRELWQQNLLSSFGRCCWRSCSDSWLWGLGKAPSDLSFNPWIPSGKQRVYFSFETELHQQLKLRNWPWSWGSWSAVDWLFPVPDCQLLTAGCCPPGNW